MVTRRAAPHSACSYQKAPHSAVPSNTLTEALGFFFLYYKAFFFLFSAMELLTVDNLKDLSKSCFMIFTLSIIGTSFQHTDLHVDYVECLLLHSGLV